MVVNVPPAARAYLRDGSAETVLSAATQRGKFQAKLAVSPSIGMLTPHQSVLTMT